jgi:hypothetical protein
MPSYDTGLAHLTAPASANGTVAGCKGSPASKVATLARLASSGLRRRCEHSRAADSPGLTPQSALSGTLVVGDEMLVAE